MMPNLANVDWLWLWFRLMLLGGVCKSELEADVSIVSANLLLTKGPGDRAETVALLFCFEGVTISGMIKVALAAVCGEVTIEVSWVAGMEEPLSLLGVPKPE